MRYGALIFLTATAMVFTASGLAQGRAAYRIGPISQQTTPEHAEAGASVEVGTRHLGTPGTVTPPPTATEAEPEVVPVSTEPTPQEIEKNTCWIHVIPPCLNPKPAEPQPAALPTPPESPAVAAERVAARIPLEAGKIEVSPQKDGLTGAPSWFWLSPQPITQTVSVTLAGEKVTVTASASAVQWGFGDGATVTAGPGVPYRPDAASASAVRHVYETRCLPGDQGRDPNVLPSCGADGYTVEAIVQWSISYTASGKVSGGGVLPSRTTSASITYPVSEARAFLASEGAAD